MIKSDLLELMANGENSGVEFKRDDLRPEQLAKEVVALANLHGGRILLGVNDDGTISGIQRNGLEEWVMDTVFGRYIHPMIIPFYEEVQLGQLRVAVITISQGVTKPYVVRNNDREDIYIRVGSTSRLATREQQARLYALGGMLHAEQLPVSGSRLADLSLDRLKHYLSTIIGDKTLPNDTNHEVWGERLCALGFMIERDDGPPVCTIAGLVLFGHAPRRHLRHAGIRWMAFEGDDKNYKALDDRLINGPLVPLERIPAGGRVVTEAGLLEKLVDAMQPFVSEEASEVDDSMRRERHWIYPVEALREAIMNALVHRDWTRYEEIEVAQYADRLEVISPGALLNSMTVEKMMAGQRSPRNPLIVDVLRDYGYVDARGMGVRNKIIPLLIQHNGTKPEFIATEDYLRLVLRNG